MRYRIEVDSETCVGDGLCCETARDTFELDCDRCCIVSNPNGDPDEDILKAARECQMQVIRVFDADTGRQVYPPESAGPA